MKSLTFYNHYGNGDLFESREFVKDWIKLAGLRGCKYATRRIPGFFDDLPQIESIDVTPDMDMRAGVTVRGDDVFVNTWIGARGDYVIWPGVGCVVENIYRMNQDLLREAGLPPLPRTIAEYLPSIDYTRIKISDPLKKFVDDHRHEKIVLLCNGPTGSGQANNFNYGPIIEQYPQRDGVVWVLTQDCPYTSDWSHRTDVFLTSKLTEQLPGVSDLNAISYLSRFCTVIVGRCSGAQMPTQVIENWMDGTKTQVCFTEHRNGACFVLNPEALGLRMKVRWSPVTNAVDAASYMKDLI